MIKNMNNLGNNDQRKCISLNYETLSQTQKFYRKNISLIKNYYYEIFNSVKFEFDFFIKTKLMNQCFL